MQLQHLPNFIRQIKNFFPDSKLNDPTSEAILERFKANNEQTTDVAIEDFLRLLSSIERPEGIPFDENVEKAVKKKDEQISELRDRVKLLTEANDNLRNDLNESNKTEINLKKKIFEMEQQLSDRTMSEPTISSSLSSQACRDLIYTLENQPIQEVKSKVMQFVDGILTKTHALNEDRQKLYGQLASMEISGTTGEITTDLTGAMDDLQKSLKLQNELLQIYEEINTTTPPKSSLPSLPSPEQQSEESEARPLLVHRRPSILGHEKFTEESPKIVKRSGVFAAYSLCLWFLGILTSLLVIEYASVADWAAEAPAISNIVY